MLYPFYHPHDMVYGYVRVDYSKEKKTTKNIENNSNIFDCYSLLLLQIGVYFIIHSQQIDKMKTNSNSILSKIYFSLHLVIALEVFKKHNLCVVIF